VQLAIFNNYALKRAVEPINFLGSHVTDVYESPVKVAVTFQNDNGLDVSLEDKDWNGPEVIELILSDGQIIVRN
jgi:hypothetical protein